MDEYIPTSTHVVRKKSHPPHTVSITLISEIEKSQDDKSHETKQYSKSNKLCDARTQFTNDIHMTSNYYTTTDFNDF